MAIEKERIYSVGQVNSLVKVVLEGGLPPRLTVFGEISGWKEHRGSGHCYFSLKDESGVLPCVMWKSSFKKVKFEPSDGMAVLGRGHIDVYPPHGKYQFYVESLKPAGVGELQMRYERMRKRLEDEGLFKEEHKKRLPSYPERIAVLTSSSGAALEDIADSIYKRWPCVRLFFHAVPVQGEGSAERIAAGIRKVNRVVENLKLDLIIVGRGGGSLEDLWAFNEEVVARAIYESKLPVISAVGHEMDVTIADLVADARASTPTKAGVIAVPDAAEVMEHLRSLEIRLGGRVEGKVKICREVVERYAARAVFRDAFYLIRMREQEVDEAGGRLAETMRVILDSARRFLQGSYEQVVKIEPGSLIGRKGIELENLRFKMEGGLSKVVSKCNVELAARENRLRGLNPRGVLRRGYSITRNKRTGAVMKGTGDVDVGDVISTELVDENRVESKVIKKENS